MSEEQAAPPQGQDTSNSANDEAAQAEQHGHQQADEQPKEEPKQSTADKSDESDRSSKGVQKRLDEMRRQIGDAQRVNDKLLSLIEKTLTKGEAVQAPVAPSGPPKRDDYESHEEYLEARSDWKVQQAIAEIAMKAERAKQEQAVKARESSWNERIEKARSKYDDFDDVALGERTVITPAMAEAIKESDMGADLAYWLGKNADEAKRIAGLSAVAQVREIGKIEARLSEKPAAKPVSKTPAPIEAIGGGKTPSNDLSKMSMDEYMATRKKQGARWAR